MMAEPRRGSSDTSLKDRCPLHGKGVWSEDSLGTLRNHNPGKVKTLQSWENNIYEGTFFSDSLLLNDGIIHSCQWGFFTIRDA